ncbi:MAG: FKBP-type peptidyl-prolyl cis-trans isomerase [Alistipes sp.]|nr:FKBP-type peptidyl-prolyl cis-trans isomerase [Alistipes sp.]
MKRTLTYIVVATILLGMIPGCNKGTRQISGEADSLSYIVGLNVGHNLLKMDSTLNVEAVCAAIRDVYSGTPKMTMEDARDYYLGQKTYFVHEKAIAYQEQFMSDLSKKERSYVRLRNGVTYKILELGDQSIQSLGSRDTVRLAYTIRNEKGDVVAEQDTVRSSFRELLSGMRELVRIAGKGGKVDAWIPSEEAYGSQGDAEKGIAPDQLLNFEISILDIELRNKKR